MKQKFKEIENHPQYKRIANEVDVLIRLAIEVFEARKNKKWSQQKLAREAKTTQKVISKIESGEVNIGLDLLQRIARCLNLRIKVGKTNLT